MIGEKLINNLNYAYPDLIEVILQGMKLYRLLLFGTNTCYCRHVRQNTIR
jgi:hypothetical protein